MPQQDASSDKPPAATLPEHVDELSLEQKRALPPSAQARFDAPEYLELFYGDLEDTVPCMQVILAYMPGVAGRLEPRVPRRMLDVGSGPTVYMGFVFRNKVAEINFSDFSDDNIRELVAFKEDKCKFNWTPVKQKIALHEGSSEDDDLVFMESQTRLKINKIYKCDVLNPKVLLDCNHPLDNGDKHEESAQFDIVTSVFCLENVGLTLEEYKLALRNVVGLLKRGGTLVLGGCFKAGYYRFNKKSYLCYPLTEEELMTGLAECGIDTENDFVYLSKLDAFIIKGTKL